MGVRESEFSVKFGGRKIGLAILSCFRLWCGYGSLSITGYILGFALQFSLFFWFYISYPTSRVKRSFLGLK